MINAEQLIGLPIHQARSICADSGCTLRVQAQDGQRFIVTADYRTNRINVEVDNGIISKTHGIG